MKKRLLFLFLVAILTLTGCADEENEGNESNGVENISDDENTNSQETEKEEMSKADALYYLESITVKYMRLSTHEVFDEETDDLLREGINNINLAIEEMEEKFNSDDPLMLSVKELGGVVKETSEGFINSNNISAEMVSEKSREIGAYVGDLSRRYLDGELPPTVNNTTQNFDEAEEKISKFVEEYNTLASMSNLELLDDSLPVNENGTQHLVLPLSIDYSILSMRAGDSLLGYSFIFKEEAPYEDLKGDALNAVLHVAGVLGLDLDSFSEQFETSLSKEENSYTENGYEIAFDNHKLTDESDFGMIISFISK